MRIPLGQFMYAEQILEHSPIRKFSKPTGIWAVLNARSDAVLGEVRWYAPWRKFCFFPKADIVFDGSCLEEITKFLTERNQVRRKRTTEATT